MPRQTHSGVSPEDIEKEALPGESWEEAERRIAQRKAKQRAESSPKPGSPPKPAAASVVRLPFWPESQRSAPNEIVRSALFNARNRKQPRQYLSNADIYVVGDGKITYTGEELRQDDETVWLHLIHLARNVPAGELIEFSPHAFCVGAAPRPAQRAGDLAARLFRQPQGAVRGEAGDDPGRRGADHRAPGPSQGAGWDCPGCLEGYRLPCFLADR
jgi:hypothetical protein